MALPRSSHSAAAPAISAAAPDNNSHVIARGMVFSICYTAASCAVAGRRCRIKPCNSADIMPSAIEIHHMIS